jgi:hypothetical protein
MKHSFLSTTLAAVCAVAGSRPSSWLMGLQGALQDFNAQEQSSIMRGDEYRTEWLDKVIDEDLEAEPSVEFLADAVAYLVVAPICASEEVVDRVLKTLRTVHRHMSAIQHEQLVSYCGPLRSHRNGIDQRVSYLVQMMNPLSQDYLLHEYVITELLQQLASSNDGVQTKQPQPARAGAIGVPA